MVTKANRSILTLAREYRNRGFTPHESTMLAWEELEPYDSVFKELGIVG